VHSSDIEASNLEVGCIGVMKVRFALKKLVALVIAVSLRLSDNVFAIGEVNAVISNSVKQSM